MLHEPIQQQLGRLGLDWNRGQVLYWHSRTPTLAAEN